MFLFDWLDSGNLNNALLKLCELILQSKWPFVRVARCFDFTNFITENKNSQYVVLNTEVSRTVVF